MTTTARTAVLALALLALGAQAQDISADEMIQLDKLRTEYKARGLDLKPEDEVRMLQRMRALKAAGTASTAGASSLAPAPAADVPAPTAPAPGRNPTPPGLMQLLQRQMGGGAVVAAPLPAAVASTTEAELRQRLADLPAAKPLGEVELLPDGLRVDGQRFADAEGRAERITVDAASATAAYLVPSGNGSSAVKLARVGSGAEPLTIGRLVPDGTRQVFQSNTGKTLAGELFFPLTDGALVMRDSVGFRYTVGEGVRQIDFPGGWAPTPVQRGNLATTGWVLLERDTSAEKDNPLQLFKRLGQLAGAVDTPADYALFNLADNRLVKLQVAADGKSVTSYSQCRRKNAVVNVCDQARSYDSLWKPDGSANLGHYYWRVDWQRPQGVPVAVVMENGLVQVNAIDLASGKRVNLFERTLGINGYRSQLRADGRLRVEAKLAFDTGVVDDALAELRSRPALAASVAAGN